MEDDRHILQKGTFSKGRNKLIAVHCRHQDVRDDQVRFVFFGDFQPFPAVTGFNHLMAKRGQQGDVELAGLHVIINDQNLGFDSHSRTLSRHFVPDTPILEKRFLDRGKKGVIVKRLLEKSFCSTFECTLLVHTWVAGTYH